MRQTLLLIVSTLISYFTHSYTTNNFLQLLERPFAVFILKESLVCDFGFAVLTCLGFCVFSRSDTIDLNALGRKIDLFEIIFK